MSKGPVCLTHNLGPALFSSQATNATCLLRLSAANDGSCHATKPSKASSLLSTASGHAAISIGILIDISTYQGDSDACEVAQSAACRAISDLCPHDLVSLVVCANNAGKVRIRTSLSPLLLLFPDCSMLSGGLWKTRRRCVSITVLKRIATMFLVV